MQRRWSWTCRRNLFVHFGKNGGIVKQTVDGDSSVASRWCPRCIENLRQLRHLRSVCLRLFAHYLKGLCNSSRIQMSGNIADFRRTRTRIPVAEPAREGKRNLPCYTGFVTSARISETQSTRPSERKRSVIRCQCRRIPRWSIKRCRIIIDWKFPRSVVMPI